MTIEGGIERVTVHFANGHQEVYGPESKEQIKKVEWVPNDEYIDIYANVITHPLSLASIFRVEIEHAEATITLDFT